LDALFDGVVNSDEEGIWKSDESPVPQKTTRRLLNGVGRKLLND
jgi:hypothetical protein